MNAELLAGNIAAHWFQSGVLAVSAVVAMRLLSLNEPRARLAALHLVLVAIAFLPLVQPWRTDEPALQMSPSATTEAAVAAISAETPAGNGLVVASWIDPNRGVVAIVWPAFSSDCCGCSTASSGSRDSAAAALDVSPPAVAGDLEAALQVSPRYIQQTGSRGPWTFGFLRADRCASSGIRCARPNISARRSSAMSSFT